MIALVRKLFWFAVFLLATFCFIVIFEHGTANFTANAKQEYADLKQMFFKDIKRKPDTSDSLGH
jgi:hypothetical protein